MSFQEIISDPLFAHILAVATFIGGIIASEYYYRKGKREGAKDTEEYKAKLGHANQEIKKLSQIIARIEALSQQNNINGIDIRKILEVKSTGINATDEEVWNHLTYLITQDNGKDAATYLAAHKDSITEERWSYFSGLINLLEGHIDTAVKLFERAVISTDNDTRYYAAHNLANIYIYRYRNAQKGLFYVNEALKILPDAPETNLLGVKCYIDLNDFETAKKLLNKVTVAFPDHPDVLRFTMMYHTWNKEYDLGIKAAKRCLELGLAPVEAYLILQDCYYFKNDLKTALGYSQKAMTLSPDNPKLLRSTSQLYLQLNDIPAAERLVNRFLALYPENAIDIFQMWARIKNKQFRYDEVIKHAKNYDFDRNVSFYRGEISEIGMAYLNGNQFENAKKIFEKVLIVSPADPEANSMLAEYYLKKPYPDKAMALKHFYEATRNDATNQAYLFCRIAEIHLANREIKIALQAVKQALEFEPESSIAKNIHSQIMSMID